jgi:transcriptional regulator with XRE-family HTH domain
MCYLPARVSVARQTAGKTRQDLGQDIGRTANTVAKYEQGVLIPTVYVLDAIARACGVDVRGLYDPDDPDDAVARLTAELEAVVAGFPPLTEQQRSQVRALLPRVS